LTGLGGHDSFRGVKRAELEQRVLSLWVTTRVPLTPVHLQLYTGLPRAKLLRMLDELVSEQILEVDSDDVGELLWTVPGAERAPDGLVRIEDVQRLEQLRSQVNRPVRSQAGSSSRGAIQRRTPSSALVASGEKKSVIASGALSFFLGPLGWLYAAPLGEAVPALAIYLVAAAIVPAVLLKPLLAVLAPLSAIAGALYAWRHNVNGERSSLLELGRSAAAGRRLLGPRRDD